MSELINANVNGVFLRKHLLSTVSCAAIVVAASIGAAAAESSEEPTVWIELGSQLERMTDGSKAFTPPFTSDFDPALFGPLPDVQRAPRYAIGGEAAISLEPKGTDWLITAAVRYGRANGKKASYGRLPKIGYHFFYLTQKPGYRFPTVAQHRNASASQTERHLIVDFQAGKEVGLGMFGAQSSSVLSLGVRFAQFASGKHVNLNGVPDFFRTGTNIKYGGLYASHHHYTGTLDVERSFHGVGPSLSWKASAPLATGEDGSLDVDFGLNGSALFGRQKAEGTQHITGQHYKFGQYVNTLKGKSIQYNKVVSSYSHVTPIGRANSVVIPNVGAFAGASFRYSNAKVSFGYRADFYFGVMDGGINTRKSYDRNFYGPYATISIGLGG